MTISGAEAERRRSLGVMLTGEIMYWLSLLSKKAALAFDLAFRAIRTRESVQAKEHLTVLRRDARRGVLAQGKGHLHAALLRNSCRNFDVNRHCHFTQWGTRSSISFMCGKAHFWRLRHIKD